MIALQITQIENGWIVALPPDTQTVQTAIRAQQQPQPKAVYCEDYTAVCECLKENWPMTIS